jgi:hypothetical protein
MKEITIKIEVLDMDEAAEAVKKFDEIMKSLTSSGPSSLEITVKSRS